MRHSLTRNANFWLILILLLSIPVKLTAARLLVWEMDYVPVVARGLDFFAGGAFPTYGTLSSVAAYNMPMLVWLQMPAMLFAHDIPTILISTQLALNFIATLFIYLTGAELFDKRVGLVAAALFTFSDTGISGAYTAWAQLLLPMFTILVLYALFKWKFSGRGIYAALAIVFTTAGFMTHFAAVLLFAVIVVFALLTRPAFRPKWLMGGVIVSVVLLAPYLAFESSREFADLRAFFNRKTNIPQAVLDEFAYLKPENQPTNTLSNEPQTSLSVEPVIIEEAESSPESSRLERAAQFILNMPAQVLRSFMLVFSFPPQTLRQSAPLLGAISQFLTLGQVVLFWGGIVWAIYKIILILRNVGVQSIAPSKHQNRILRFYFQLGDILTETQNGRYLLLVLGLLVIVGGLIVTRSGPDQQPSYYMGLLGAQMVLIAAAGVQALDSISRITPQCRISVLIGAVVVICGLTSLDRVLRVSQHDQTQSTLLNMWLYDNINDATHWIAADWGKSGPIAIRYDIMAENTNLWWIAPWNTVDSLYRIGAPYDFLLATYYNIENRNTSAIGEIENPNYTIAYETGLERYDLAQFDMQQFGAIFVLKPKTS